jgi:beta-glucosidase
MYKNYNKPIDERVEDLLNKMTLEEKISQMIYSSKAIERLDVPAYNWWNEALHGVANAGIATVFPQAIGMGASFDKEMVFKVASVISDEARAKYHEFIRKNDRSIFKGLTFWSPNINIFRDPRWGRGQETYGEDPYLTGRLGVAFIKGMQGDDPKYLKTAACAKHYAVHSGPEMLRHQFNAQVSLKDLRETYLPAFRDAVKEGKVEAVMGAYNRVNGEPACASKMLIEEILRKEWKFEGHFVSDCGAIQDIYEHHKFVETAEEAAAIAVKRGCDLNCGRTYESLKKAVEKGLISEEEINTAVRRLFKTRFKLGMFDPDEEVKYASIPFEKNDCEEHRRLALEMAHKTIVLLKNEGNLLPLNKEKIKSIAVIGPNADNVDVLLGNYNGTPSKYVTPLEGIRNAVDEDVKVYYSQGCDLTTPKGNEWGFPPNPRFSEAISYAERSDVVIMCLGISPRIEGEEGLAYLNTDYKGDRPDLSLPGMQEQLLKEIHKTGKPIILALFNGSPITINWAQENIPAIVECWYPGEEGGTALADVIFGKYNPAGRLPITFVKSVDQLPPFTDYSMKGRTYRYMQEEPLYPFGYGLSYSNFEYSGLKLDPQVVDIEELKEVEVKITVKNISNIAGEEVAQLYIKDIKSSVKVPKYELKGFKRIYLEPQESKSIEFTITPRQLSLINEEGRCVLEPGEFKIYVGGQQPDERSKILTGKEVLSVVLNVKGENVLEIEY